MPASDGGYYLQARRRISLRFHAACFYGRLRLLSCEAVDRGVSIPLPENLKNK